MEYVISDFVNNMRNKMYNLFPYEDDFTNEQKHVIGTWGKVKNPKPKHIRDVAFMENIPQNVGDNMIVFDIGNEFSEREYPYYHILEEAPVIRIKGYGSDKTKGSQEKVVDKGNRDYTKVNFNGKTFSKEYARNIRGARNNIVKRARYWKVGGEDINPLTGVVYNRVRENKESKSYRNEWYQYIEMMLSTICPELANEYGMKLSRVSSSGLIDEYINDNYNTTGNAMDIGTMQSIAQILSM